MSGELMTSRTNAPPINDQLKPDKNSTDSPDRATINPVPKSGCRATKKMLKK